MPQGLTVPAWYNDDHYISEKVDECNTIKFGAVEGEEFTPWTEASVRDFMAAANNEASYASWMGYDNFVSNGNAENCSPSRYFVVAEYLQAKANQLNEIEYQDKTDWTQADVLKAFKDANISAWDHYTTNGQAEGINPSNAFDNDAFFAAKCELLNAWQNEDGTVGYEGKDNWTKDDVVAVFQSLNINPIMNQPENPDAASLIIAVPSEEQVSGGNFNPWANIDLVDKMLTVGPEKVDDGGEATNFIGLVSDNALINTLDRQDQITGTNDDDQLTATLDTSFNGFQNGGFMKGVPVVNLSSRGHFDFRANNVTGTETYNVNGNIDVLNLNQDVKTVNLANVNADVAEISFVNSAVSGKNDTLAVGLDNVFTFSNPDAEGAQKPVAVQIETLGIEGITVNSTGTTTNRATFVDPNLQTLAVTGNADANLSTTSTRLTQIDASAATGDIAVTSNNNKIASAKFGAGDDTLTTAGITPNAVVDGGDGDDSIVLTGNASGKYALYTNSVETLGFDNTNGNVIINGSNMVGLEGIALIDQTKSVTLNKVGDELDATVQGSNTAGIIAPEITSLSVTVGDGVASETPADADTYAGAITAKNLTSLYVNVAEDDAQFNLAKNGNLTQLSQITLSGEGDVDLSAAAIGAKAETVTVQAGQMTGDLDLAFNGSAKQSLYITGSQGGNDITLGGKYDYFEIVSDGTSNFIDMSKYTGEINADSAYFNLNGNTSIWAGDAAKAAAIKALVGDDVDVQADLANISQENLASGMYIELPKALTVTPGAVEGDADYSGITSSCTAPLTVDYTRDGQLVELGNTGQPYLPDGAVVLTRPTTVVDAVGQDNVVLDFASENEGNVFGLVTSSATAGGTDTKGNSNVVLDLSNSGGSDVVLTAAGAEQNVSGVYYDYGMNNVKTLNLDTGDSADGSVTLASHKNVSGSYDVASTRMYNVTDVNITGAGDAILNSQIGYGADTDNPSAMTFDASGSTGNVSTYLIAVPDLTYKGSEGVDDFSFQVTGENSNSSIDLGAGNDEVQILVNRAGCTSGATGGNGKISNVTMDLGDGDDMVTFYGTGTTGQSGGTALTINDLRSGDLLNAVDGAETPNNFGMVTFDSAATAKTVFAQFGFNFDVTGITGTNLDHITVGGNTYVAVKQGGLSATTTLTDTQMEGFVAIKLVGVNNINISENNVITAADVA